MQPTQDASAVQYAQAHRKSVSFDLSDNEYIPVFENEPIKTSIPKRTTPPRDIEKPTRLPDTDDIAQLYLSQFSRNEEDGDGYEIPIKYSTETKPFKSILRSPSPSAAATTPTQISSLDRPLSVKSPRVPPPQQTVTAAIVHTRHPDDDDEEIERENPFRNEFLGYRPYENVYEELRFDNNKTKQEKPIEYAMSADKKVRPKSAYYTEDPYTEILPKSYHSNEHLVTDISDERITVTKPTSKSTGNLVTERPKHKPPLPPKPPTQPSNVKHANLVQNEALKTFQNEMQRGDFYEYRHDHSTNKIIKIKHDRPELDIKQPIEIGKLGEREELHTVSNIPESPSPLETQTTPPYTKINKKACNTNVRPSASPPPPPINLSTLPTIDKLRNIETEDGTILEILPTKIDVLPLPQRAEYRHENSSDNILVTEATHREIMLQENEMRNAMQQQQEEIVQESTTTTTTLASKLPLRKAPPPPPPQSSTSVHQEEPFYNRSNESPSSRQIPSHAATLSPSQIFPPTQILPVQYSHLPIPQQPGYYHTFSPTPMAVNYPSGIPVPSGFSSYAVSDLIQQNVIPSNMAFMGQPCLSMSIPSFHSTANQNFQQQQQTPHYVNVVTNPVSLPFSPTAAAPLPFPNNTNNSNWNYINEIYQNVYNRQILQEQLGHEQVFHHSATNIAKPVNSSSLPHTPIQSPTQFERFINNNNFSTLVTTTTPSTTLISTNTAKTKNTHTSNVKTDSTISHSSTNIPSSSSSSFTVSPTTPSPSSSSTTLPLSQNEQTFQQMSLTTQTISQRYQQQQQSPPSSIVIAQKPLPHRPSPSNSPIYENPTDISELSPIRIVSPAQNSSSSNYRDPAQNENENKRTLITFGKQTSV